MIATSNPGCVVVGVASRSNVTLARLRCSWIVPRAWLVIRVSLNTSMRRAKARLSSGCESHPRATFHAAPSESLPATDSLRCAPLSVLSTINEMGRTEYVLIRTQHRQ